MSDQELAGQLFGGGEVPSLGVKQGVSEKFTADQPEMKNASMEASVGMGQLAKQGAGELADALFGGNAEALKQGMSDQGMDGLKMQRGGMSM
jgi:hypothetical protein